MPRGPRAARPRCISRSTAACAASAFAAAYNGSTACAHYAYVACRLYDYEGCATVFYTNPVNNSRPSYVWGYSARGITCLYNPACWTVACAVNASSAGYATSASTASSATSATSATKLVYYKDMFALCKSSSGTTCIFLMNRCAFPGIFTLSPSVTQCCGAQLNGYIGRYFGSKCCVCTACCNNNPFCLCFGGFRVG